jgi:molybdopterin converting factor small subunit
VTDRETVSEAPSDSDTEIVRVRLFSVLHEKVGQAVLRVDVGGPTTGAALLDRLVEAHPVIEAYRSSLRLAVGERYASEEETVHPGDEVALITPVSGG